MSEETEQKEIEIPASKDQIKIFLIDDDKFLLDMYSLKFKSAGLAVELAFSGDEALKKIKSGYTPDIILLDIIMPNMDGLEFFEILRKENLAKDSAVIILTNNQGEDDNERAKKLGAAGFLIKAMNIPSDVVTQTLEIYKTKKK